MSSKDIKNYVINCLKKGFSKQAILIVTQNAGWSEEDIDKVFEDEEVETLLSKIEEKKEKEKESEQKKEESEEKNEVKSVKEKKEDEDEKEKENNENVELDTPPSPIPESSEEKENDKEKKEDEDEKSFDESLVPEKDSKKENLLEKEEESETEESEEDIKEEIDSELKSYVLEHLNEGFRVKVVKIGAVDNGWSEEDIDKVFEDEEIKSLLLKKKEEKKEKEKKEEKELKEDEEGKNDIETNKEDEEDEGEDPLSFLLEDDNSKNGQSLPVKKSPKNKTKPSSEDTTDKTPEEIALMEKDKSEKKEEDEDEEAVVNEKDSEKNESEEKEKKEEDEERVKEIKKNLEIKDEDLKLKDSESKKENLKNGKEESSEMMVQEEDEEDVDANETLKTKNIKPDLNQKSDVNEKLEENIEGDEKEEMADKETSEKVEDFSKEDSLKKEEDKEIIDDLIQEEELGFKESEILNQDEDLVNQDTKEGSEDSKKDELILEETKQAEDSDEVENDKKKESLLEKENVTEDEDEESVFYTALLKYVVEHLKAGFDEHEIKEEVINAGWPGGEVSKVFKEEEVIKLLSLVEKQSQKSTSFEEKKSSDFQQPEIFEVNRKESDNYQNSNNLNQDTNKKDGQLNVADFQEQSQDPVSNQDRETVSNEVNTQLDNTDNFNSALKSYVVTRLKKGFDKEIVSFGANNAGWSSEEVKKVFEDEDVQVLLSNKEKKENKIQNNYSEQRDDTRNNQKEVFNKNVNQASEFVSNSNSDSDVNESFSDSNNVEIKEEGLNKNNEKVREPNPLLKSYIFDNLKRGFDPESIKKTAIEAGWPEENVNRVLTSPDAEEIIFKRNRPEEYISSNDNLVKTRPSSDTPVQANNESQFVEPGTVGNQSVDSYSQQQPSSYPQQPEQTQNQIPPSTSEQSLESTTTPGVKTRPSSDTPVQANNESQFVEPGTVGNQSVDSYSQPQPSSYPQQSGQFQTQTPPSPSEESVEQFNEQSLESTTTPGVKTRPSSDATPVQSNEDNDFVEPDAVSRPLDDQSPEQISEDSVPEVENETSFDNSPVSEEKIPKKSRVTLADIPDYSTLKSKQVPKNSSTSKLENSDRAEKNKDASVSKIKKLEFINGKAKRDISNPASFFIEESYSSSEFEDAKQGKVKNDKKDNVKKEKNLPPKKEKDNKKEEQNKKENKNQQDPPVPKAPNKL